MGSVTSAPSAKCTVVKVCCKTVINMTEEIWLRRWCAYDTDMSSLWKCYAFHSLWWLTAAHLWQLVSEASWQDRPHTSSIMRDEALWAFHASGESQCRVMKEKRPALSTGCWCLWHNNSTGSATQCCWEELAWPHVKECSSLFCAVCVWTAFFIFLTKALGCSEKVAPCFYQLACVQTWTRAGCEWRIRAPLSRPHLTLTTYTSLAIEKQNTS